MKAILALAGFAAALVAGGAEARAQSLQELQSLSIEQLSQIEITSVARHPEPISDTPAAVYVITSEDIRRSGALTLPEVLRLAPNLEVARQDAASYAISARGFNSFQVANKLLVLIDGRSVYSPLHSGVFWDRLQPPLDDIDRIEVISGPAGAVWGSNAFSGVINIITKNARDTQGGLLDFSAGPVDQSGLLQYGGKFGDQGTYRVYGSGLGIGHTDFADGSNAKDSWYNAQTGFRVDWQGVRDAVLTEGDFYRNANWQSGWQYGGDVLTRWNRRLDNGSNIELQSSFDDQYSFVPGVHDSYWSYDLQGQHTFTTGRHLIVWGGEMRLIQDRFVNYLNEFVLVPPSRTIGIGDVFAQDTISLPHDLKLTLGTKIEYSSYTGVDFLPSVRLGWRASPEAFFWAAISRAVRTPSRIDRELQAPGFLLPALDFRSEKLIAYEVGYRGRPTPATSLSISFYYNTYQDLRTTNILSTNPPLFQLGNGMEGHGYGMEAWGDWRVVPWWRVSAGVNLLHKDLHLKPGVNDFTHEASGGDDPGYQVMFRSSMDLPHNVELDFGIRAVDALPAIGIPAYVSANARIGWHVTPKLEISLAGYNLLTRHAETVTPPAPVQFARRSIYLGLRAGF